MNNILFLVSKYFDSINNGSANINEALLDEFARSSRVTLNRTINEERDRFTIRMSAIGKPLCILQMDKSGAVPDATGTFFSMKMMYGGCVEALAMAIMKAAKVNVQAEQVPVKLKLSRGSISGTFDVLIDDRIYDIKSASDYSFEQFNKDGVNHLLEDDPFGYLAQGIGYSLAYGKPYGGLIIINKVTGQWLIVEVPHDKALYDRVLADIEKKHGSLIDDEPFKRCFEDEDEVFYGKATGNKILGRQCMWCKYRTSCWPHAQVLPSIPSKAKDKKLTYYSYVDPKYLTPDS